jgi:PKD repeat protein
MTSWSIVRARLVAGPVALLLAAGTLGMLVPGTAQADSAPPVTSPATPTTVTADGLPTVQINGVVWSQVVVGTTVYAAGSFTRARPAGAAAGTQETVRNNLLAYDIRTGALITSFAPSLNAQALVVTASPDGSRIYVGGDFTQVDGQTRNRVAALTPAGTLISTWRPSVSSQVRAIAATNDTVYLGGSITAVGGVSRTRLAAVSAATGALLPWAPVPGVGSVEGNELPNNDPRNQQTSNAVLALVLTSGGSQVVAAGRFDSLNGVKATGVGALDAVTGETRPFAVNQLITNQGVNSAVYSLSTDGTAVYGTGYDFYGPGNLEGSFAATADGGQVIAVNDCHGDHYSSFAVNGALYFAGHPHDCSNIGGYPEENPRINKFATAVSTTATGTVGGNTLTNGNLQGQPAASLLNWFPTMSAGSVTGQAQAGWSVTGTSEYVVFGGEFPRVNGVAQQGLVRYAIPALAPNKVGPNANDGLTPTVVSLSAGSVRVSWQSTYDQDNANLTYRVVRSDKPTQPVFETTAASTFWNRPSLGFVDRDVQPGTRYTYRVYAYDPFGNSATRSSASVTVSTDTASGGLYGDTVLADSPEHFWRLGEAAGTAKGYDQAGFDDLTLGTGVTQGAAGALAGTGNTAAAFDGTSAGTGATPSPVPGPKTFSVEAWFSTTTRSGGKIIGFGNTATGTSNSYDRHVYMDDSGRVFFGVWLGWGATLETSRSYNDGAWHHVVATDGPNGLALFMDGQLVGQRADATGGQDYTGYWRVGGDTAWAGSSPWFAGRIDEVAVYRAPLTSAQVQRHFVVGSTGQTYNEPPQARFESSSLDGTARLFDGSMSIDPDGTVAGYRWDFGDGTTATGASVEHTFAAPGSYRVTLTVTDSRGATATAATVVAATAAGTDPSAYTQAVLNSGAEHFWRFGETSGRVYDYAGTADLAVGTGVARGTAGAITGDADTATTFNGSGEGRASTQTAAPGPNVFSLETWFRTSSTSGGKLVGYGNQSSGNSSNYDRHLYMDESGRLRFGVWTGAMTTVQSAAGLNDGLWHHVVGSLNAQGLALYVDGRLVDSRSDVTAGQPYDGYWRIGGDSTWAGANYFSGVLDDVAIYPAALTPGTVAEHYTMGTSGGPANQAPTAMFTSAVTGLHLAVDAGFSADHDGRIVGYAWNFGDGSTATGMTAAHDYATAGTYSVTLTVTDDDGAASTMPTQLTVTAPPANQAPVAAFTATSTDLTVALDAVGSTDPDGDVVAWAWAFGDGSSGTGETATHDYATAGTYRVALTVTDDDGATATTEQDVTVSAPPAGPAVLADDTFGRTVTGGLGTADTGGAWTVSGGGTRQSVTPGVAELRLDAAGNNTGSYLGGVSGTRTDVTTTFSLTAAPTGNGTYVYVTGRRVGTGLEYRVRVRLLANGTVGLVLSRLSGGTEAFPGGEVIVPGLTYTAGQALNVRVQVSGTGTTQITARAWLEGSPEPVAPTMTRTDTTATLQEAGAVGLLVHRPTGTTAVTAVRFTAFRVTELP